MVRHGLGQHGLASPGGSPQEHTARGVNADLTVELVMRQGQLHGFLDFLLLNIIAANVLAHHNLVLPSQVNNVRASHAIMGNVPGIGEH